MGDRSSEETAQRQAVWRQRGECHQSSNGVTGARPLKNNQGERIEEMVLMHVWHSGNKPFQAQTHIFFSQGLLLRDKMTIFTGSKMSFDTVF
jgi:hypothetical protein